MGWLFLGLSYAAHQDGPPADSEDELLFKAALVFNFAKFTSWPGRSLSGASTSFNLCTVGNDPLVDAMQGLTGKTVKSRPVRVTHWAPDMGAEVCHLLYVADSASQYLTEIKIALALEPVLTVSEIPGFATDNGIVELYRSAGRTRFIINLNMARALGLEMSSRLLNLADKVYQQQP